MSHRAKGFVSTSSNRVKNESRRSRKSSRLIAASALLFGAGSVLMPSTSARAASISSTNGNANTGNWNSTSTWTDDSNNTLHPIPGAADSANIGNAATSGNVIVTDTQAAQRILIAFQNSHGLEVQSGGDLSIGIDIQMSNNGVPAPMAVSGGALHMGSGIIYDGFAGAGTGTFTQTGGAISGSNNRLYIGYLANGIFNQSGGTNTANIFGIGNGSGRTGTFNLSGTALLNPVQNFIGTNFSGTGGTGTLNQTGGSFSPGNLTLAATLSTTSGTYNLSAGSFTMNSGQNLIIGEKGTAVWNIGDAAGTATITQGTAGGLGIYTVRADAGASGTIHGWGNVPFSGNNFINNGRIIADGFGTQRTLDLSAPSKVGNTIENISANGSTNNGYFANNKGKLVLPAIANITANTRNWGEADTGSAQSDSQIDLVNSVQMTFGGTITNGGSGNLGIALVSLDYDGGFVGYNPVGLWEFVKNGGLDFGSLGLTFRYDDVAAGGNESQLKLFYRTTGDWQPLASTLDTTNKLISSSGAISGALFASGTGPTDFLVATAIPEPTSLALIALGIAPLIRRRRRTR